MRVDMTLGEFNARHDALDSAITKAVLPLTAAFKADTGVNVRTVCVYLQYTDFENGERVLTETATETTTERI